MAYRLFIANKKYSSWSMRPWVLMEAQGIAFEEVLRPFTGAQRQPEFDLFSPTGKVPCLYDGDTVVWDSLAIVEHLAERHAGLWPKDAYARSWARAASAEMHAGFPALRDECSMNCQLVIAHREPSGSLIAELRRLTTLWRQGLECFGGPWLAGDSFTAVDAFYAPVAVRIRGYNLQLATPAMDYVARCLAHPAVDRWVNAGIQETLKEPHHHEDSVRGRAILKDLADAS